jgi:hypothetical protein
MTNLVLILFPSEENALKGAHRLRKLEFLGDISIFGKVMIRKSETGELMQLEDDGSESFWISSGAAFSALINTAGIPVAIIDQLKPGTVAILAEINGDDPFLVEDEVSSLGAKVFRSGGNYIYLDNEEGGVKELDEDIATERRRLKSETADDKLQVKYKIAELKEKRTGRIQELRKTQRAAKRVRLINRIQEHREEIFRLEQRIDEIKRNKYIV